MIQEARSRPAGVLGIFRSGITLGRAVTTTVWSRAVTKAPRPITTRTRGAGIVCHFMLRLITTSAAFSP